jgi:hypothetical protein
LRSDTGELSALLLLGFVFRAEDLCRREMERRHHTSVALEVRSEYLSDACVPENWDFC